MHIPSHICSFNTADVSNHFLKNDEKLSSLPLQKFLVSRNRLFKIGKCLQGSVFEGSRDCLVVRAARLEKLCVSQLLIRGILLRLTYSSRYSTITMLSFKGLGGFTLPSFKAGTKPFGETSSKSAGFGLRYGSHSSINLGVRY